MGNMCCRRVGYSPNGAELDNNRCLQQQQQQQQQLSKTQTMSNVYHSNGDDCAINELLEGRMDLDVILPDGRQVRLTVERRTPMMDLLVQAASATKISPVGHVIHVFGDSGKGSNTLQYKPSTPIGSLDTNTICIVPKKDVQEPTIKRAPRIANRPFEPTFRVQVHLPRNQLTVVRVSPRVKISELRNMVCQEKGLETNRYQLVRPSDPAQALSGDLTLAEYGSTEITLLSNASIESNICNSTSHIMSYSKRGEEQKKKTGILRLLAEDAHKKVEKKLLSNGNNRLAPTTKVSDNNAYQGRYKPKKRRPAPPPPPPVLPEAPFHSRQSSSDSSGYHEATSSFLHEEHCTSTDEKASSDSSGVSSLDAKLPAMEAPPIPNARKRKAPPPPPPIQPTVDDSPKIENDKSTENINKTEVPKSDAQLLDKKVEVLSSKKDDQKEQNVKDQNSSSRPKEDLKSDLAKGQTCSDLVEQAKEAQRDEPKSDHHVEVTQKVDDHQTESDKPLKQETLHPTAQIHVNAQSCHVAQETPSDIAKKEENLPHCTAIELTASEMKPISNSPSDVKETKRDAKTEKKPKTSELVTRVALVALNARIEQDVTQQEIASSIQAAFHSVDIPQRVKPSLLSIKQRINLPKKNQSHVTQDGTCNENSADSNLPQVADKTVSASDDSLYPLQKSSAILSLNVDSKEDDIGIETVLPPPTEFRSDEKEAFPVYSTSECSTTSTVSDAGSTLKRSSSLLSVAEVSPKYPTLHSKKNSNIQRSLSNVHADDKEEFSLEQEKLQREYIELQKQFLVWQQQVLKNQAMLSEECMVSQYARTLRQSHSLPEGEDFSDDAPSSIPLVSRSLSYEPTKNICSTLPRSTINIPSLELNSLPITNGTSTLRSSKNKNYFKPPQVRISTKSRQRLPPEIRKDGELDISDDSKMLSTILPSFDTLKFIAEHKDEEVISKTSDYKNSDTNVKLENNYNNKMREEAKTVRRPQNPNKLATFPKPHTKISNGVSVKNGPCSVVAKCVNKNNSQSNGLPASAKVTEHSISPLPPPPPPLPSESEKPKEVLSLKTNKSSINQNKAIKKEIQPQIDPREQLMAEIRKMGGRTALRKISLY
uniref:WH2 domain-containing protein n=1 Tax=Parasteatoda tepidariorum TaxID=114398 RepID=A0A2L2YCA0_PARTP